MSTIYCTYRICIEDYKTVVIEELDANRKILGRSKREIPKEKLTTKLKKLMENAREDKLESSEDVSLLGEALFDIIFDEVRRHNFVQFYEKSVYDLEQKLRIEIDIDERKMPEIAALPWELMRIPQIGDHDQRGLWLATTRHIVLCRRRSHWKSPKIKQYEKLRIALVISKPNDLNCPVYQEIINELKILEKQQPHKIKLLPVVDRASYENTKKILQEQPNIFHFIGHGRFNNTDGNETGEIAFVGESGKANWVNSEKFSNIFDIHHPNVVILHVCEGATSSLSKPFVSVASKVIEKKIPIVIAMQYKVTNKTANIFAHKFYRELSQDKPVDLSVQEAREEIADKTDHEGCDFATPVIFTCVGDNHFFDTNNIFERGIEKNINTYYLDGSQSNAKENYLIVKIQSHQLQDTLEILEKNNQRATSQTSSEDDKKVFISESNEIEKLKSENEQLQKKLNEISEQLVKLESQLSRTDKNIEDKYKAISQKIEQIYQEILKLQKRISELPSQKKTEPKNKRDPWNI